MELTINLEPTIKQYEAYQALDTIGIDEVFFGGGAGGGKSWSICESRLIKAIQYAGYKSFIGRNELKRLMQSTFQTWMKVCKKHNIPRNLWNLNGQYNYIELWNGSRIDLLDLKFMPAEDPLYERFGSLEYTDGAIEEAGEVHPLAHEVLKSRVNRHLNRELGINASLLLTGNPKKNWTYQQFYKPWKTKTLPENIRFIQALYKDNPYTAEEYGKTLLQIKDKVMRERLRDGNWEYEDDPAHLIIFDAISDLFTNELEESNDLYLTADIARYGNDKTVVTLWNGWEAYKILYREKQGIDQTINWIKELLHSEHIPFSHAIADEDGIGGGVVDGLRGIKGFVANSSPLEEAEERRSSKVYANLKTQCAYHLAEKINNREASVKTNNEQIKAWLVEDLEQIREDNIDADDKKRKLVSKEEIKPILGRSPDFGDTFIMRSYFDLQKEEVSVVTQYRPSFISRR